jgi:hypothetical protein
MAGFAVLGDRPFRRGGGFSGFFLGFFVYFGQFRESSGS